MEDDTQDDIQNIGFQVKVWSRLGHIFLMREQMEKVEKSREVSEGKFFEIPPSLNANLTAGNVEVSLH